MGKPNLVKNIGRTAFGKTLFAEPKMGGKNNFAKKSICQKNKFGRTSFCKTSNLALPVGLPGFFTIIQTNMHTNLDKYDIEVKRT